MPLPESQISYRGTQTSTITTARAELLDSMFDNDWLNPISMSKLQRAVKNGAETVELNGTIFSIEIGEWYYSPYDGKRKSVRLKRIDGGFAPFGYISLKRILSFDFETSE